MKFPCQRRTFQEFEILKYEYCDYGWKNSKNTKYLQKKFIIKLKIIWFKTKVKKDHYCNTTCILGIGCENSDLVDVQNIVGAA